MAAESGKSRTSGLAVVSLILGCFFIVPILGIIPSLLAVILGIVAAVKISKNRNALKGKGLAVAGIVLGSLGVILMPVLAVILAIAIPNAMLAKVRAQEAGAAAAMRAIYSAEISYSLDNGRFASLEELSSGSRPYFDKSLIGSEDDIYRFSVGGFDKEYFYATAVPLSYIYHRLFYIDEDGALCVSEGSNLATITSHIAQEVCPPGYREYDSR